MAEHWVSRAEFAQILGCTPKTITNYSQQGMPTRGGGKKGSPLEVETVAAIAWYVRFESKKQSLNYDTPADGDVNYEREKALEKSVSRQIKEVELEQMRGNLLPRDEVEYVCVSALSAVKQQILPAGRRIIPKLRQSQNEALALKEFDRILYAALEAAAQQIGEIDLNARVPEAPE